MAEQESNSSDESLDATSQKFDPLKALYSSKTVIPTPSAPAYDNLHKYESVQKGSAISTLNIKPSVTEEASKRKFLPHQLPVAGRKLNPWTELKGNNVLTKMKKTFGPLSMLFEAMEKKTRLKVFTRNAQGIRGHVEAYVAAFDKHWNLALEDCLEVWTRKVKRKAPALGPPTGVNIQVRDEDVPKVVVKKSNGKTETLERHVPQMLLRGEQIAIIVKIN